MLDKILYALPELLLLVGVLNLFWLHLLTNDSPKAYARAARFWLLASLCCSTLFYDKSLNPLYFANNSYTLLFILISGGYAYAMLGLSTSWFSAENKTGCKYYILILLAFVGINLLISAINLIALLFSYILLIFINYRLLQISCDKLPSEASVRYMGISAVIIVLFTLGFGYIGIILKESPDYASLSFLFEAKKTNFPLFMASAGLIIPFLYSLGIAPFHVITEEKAGKAILPVSCYFAVVVPIAFFGAFVKLNLLLLPPYGEVLRPLYKIFALLSVVFGAIGANARINLHRICAFGTLYQLGLIMLLLSIGTPEANFAAFICLFIYILNLSGIYLVLFSLKSHGEYLSSLTSLSGLAETKPYTTGVLLISLFSLLSLPPLAGFLGQFNLVYALLNNKEYFCLGFTLICLLVLAKAYLEILKTAYFEHKVKIYDKENKLVLFYILINSAIIAVMAFNPLHIIEILEEMYHAVYL